MEISCFSTETSYIGSFCYLKSKQKPSNYYEMLTISGTLETNGVIVNRQSCILSGKISHVQKRSVFETF